MILASGRPPSRFRVWVLRRIVPCLSYREGRTGTALFIVAGRDGTRPTARSFLVLDLLGRRSARDRLPCGVHLFGSGRRTPSSQDLSEPLRPVRSAPSIRPRK